MITERFNESIFDALPTYLLNICEVCGSSQCPYCSIYNMGWRASMSMSLLFFSVFIYLLLRVAEDSLFSNKNKI